MTEHASNVTRLYRHCVTHHACACHQARLLRLAVGLLWCYDSGWHEGEMTTAEAAGLLGVEADLVAVDKAVARIVEEAREVAQHA